MAVNASRPAKSTTGRSIVQTAVQGYFGALSRAAPSLAVRHAARIFFTPPPRPRRALPPLAGWEPRAGRVRVGDRVVHTWRYGRGPIVLFVHGWGGSAHDWPAIAAGVIEAGYTAVLADFVGHGHAGRGQTSLPEMARGLHAVANDLAFSAGDRFEPLEAVVAHSFGGAATVLAMRDGLLARSLVLLAPVAHPMAFLDPVIAGLGLSPALRPQMVERIRQRAGGDLGRIEVVPAAATLGVPGLIVHDHHDATVPWSDGRDIARAWPRARMISTDGLGHRGVLRDPGVSRTVTDYLLEASGRRIGHEWPTLEAVAGL